MKESTRAGVKVFFFGMGGIMIAAIEYVMYMNGVLVDEFVVASETVTIANIMAATVILALLLGVVYALTS